MASLLLFLFLNEKFSKRPKSMKVINFVRYFRDVWPFKGHLQTEFVYQRPLSASNKYEMIDYDISL